MQYRISIVKNQPLHVSKHVRFNEDGGMHEFIKRTQQYNLQKMQDASALIGRWIVSATVTNVQF